MCPSRCVLWLQIPQHNHEEFSAINVLFLTEEAEAEETLSWGHTVIGGPAEFDLGSLTPDLEKRRVLLGSLLEEPDTTMRLNLGSVPH